MSNSTFVTLDVKINQLKEVVKSLDTNTIATYCFWEIFRFGTMGERVNLSSPARQSLYLLGVACSSPEPSGPPANAEGKIQQFENLLNDIFGKYLKAYFPTKDDLESEVGTDWYKAREVAMPMFLNYFFEGKKIATGNYVDIIHVYFDGFEADIKEYFGIDHIQMLQIGELIGEQIQSRFDRFHEIMDVLKVEHEALQHVQIEDFGDFMSSVKERTGHLAKELGEIMESSVTFGFDHIRGVVGDEVLDKFKRIFITERGASPEIKYLTEDNPVSYKPIVTSGNEEYILPSLNLYYDSVILNLERFFKSSKKADQFRKARDNRLEKEAYHVLKNFLPDTAILLESVFENKLSHNEHDLVILNDRDIIIVEAKAAARREPLRDPSKAYQRMRDDFKRNSGIQSASNQLNNLRRLIFENQETPLYDKKGKLLHTIQKDSYDNVYCICVTKDDFGMLATNLTLMLEKREDEPYPWVICIQDLKFLLNCLSEIGLKHEYFLEYIRERVDLNGKAFSTDELEFAGAYLNYGGFDFINKNPDAKVFLDINESRVFDEIYLEKVNGRVYVHEIKEPTYHALDRKKIAAVINLRKIKRVDKKSKKKEQKKSRRNNR